MVLLNSYRVFELFYKCLSIFSLLRDNKNIITFKWMCWRNICLVNKWTKMIKTGECVLLILESIL